MPEQDGYSLATTIRTQFSVPSGMQSEPSDASTRAAKTELLLIAMSPRHGPEEVEKCSKGRL